MRAINAVLAEPQAEPQKAPKADKPVKAKSVNEPPKVRPVKQPKK